MRGLRAVSFDCWNTLLYEAEPGRSYARRVELLAGAARALGAVADLAAARAALDRAWERHWKLWHAEVASGAPEMAAWALESLLGAAAPAGEAERLGQELSEALIHSQVHALEDAREALEQLAARGLRRALICDTGLSGAAVVRRILDREGLLEHLEVTIFSDEMGVPKPHARVFQAALEPLGLAERPAEALHVGDLRRTDVAGARSAGMRTVRIRERHDDRGELTDADRVVDSHRELLALLGLSVD